MDAGIERKQVWTYAMPLEHDGRQVLQRKRKSNRIINLSPIPIETQPHTTPGSCNETAGILKLERYPKAMFSNYLLVIQAQNNHKTCCISTSPYVRDLIHSPHSPQSRGVNGVTAAST
jgi:hypothetical protein